jgi:hypothetical protein
LTFNGVDPGDDTAVASDVQPFSVAGATTTVGDDFFVTVTGGGVNPFVFYVIGADTGECFQLANGTRPCETNSKLPLAGSVRLEHYWTETTTSMDPPSADGKCDAGGVRVNIKGKENVPTFRDYAVTTPGVTGAIANPGKNTETTTFNFTSISAGQVIPFTMTAQAEQYASATTCTVGNGNNTTITGWSKPWE